MMNKLRNFVLLLSLVAVASAVKYQIKDIRMRAVRCASKYQKTAKLREDGEVHTMCKYPKSNSYKSGKIRRADIRKIVDKHNEYRKDPRTTETAAAMCKMYWDPKIATIAQHFAKSCPTGHDKNNIVPGYGATNGGQNLAWGYADWSAAVDGWFNEVQYFVYGKGSSDSKKSVGHYTQVVKDTACRIGCGFANCNGKKTYVCNYLTGQTDYSNPFVAGAPCSHCKDKCVDGKLCDTGGKMCYHGTMDYNTTTCTCDKPYTGDSCEILQCDGTQGYSCGKSWDKSYCLKYSNVPGDCPIMCEVCTTDKKAGANWIPAPKARLKSGSTGKAGSFPAGRVKTVKAPSGGTGNKGGTGSTGCEDNTHCMDPGIFDISYCTRFPDFKYATVNGVKYTPLELCPKSCGKC